MKTASPYSPKGLAAPPAASLRVVAVYFKEMGNAMKACYIDESGCPNVLHQTSNPDVTPIFVVTAVFFDLDDLPEITGEFTFLKQKHFWPNESWHNCMHMVYKGSEIRRAARSDYKPDQQRNIRFLTRVLKLLHKKGAKVVSMVYIKGIGKSFNSVAVYTQNKVVSGG